MKKIGLLIIGVLVAVSGLQAETWNVVSEPDFPVTLNDVAFATEMTGWVVGDDGFIYNTTDGGDTWEQQATDTENDIDKVCFWDETTGWAGTVKGSVLWTADGGATWTESTFADQLPHVKILYFRSMDFTSATEGHIVAGKYKMHYVLKTVDGGKTWAVKDSLADGTRQSWYDVNFFNENVGAIVGDKKWTQRYTTDGGETWVASDSIADPMFNAVNAVRWLDETTAVAAGDGNDWWGISTPFYKSIDGGKTWDRMTQDPADVKDRVKDMYFRNATDGIGVGNNGFSLQYLTTTTDGGETWTASYGPLDFGLKAICGVGDNLFVVGTGSHLLRSPDFGATWELLEAKPPVAINGIAFAGGKGYAVTKNSDVLTSPDGSGSSWDYAASAGMWDANDIKFIDENTGFVLKENRHILKTENAGQDWATVLEPTAFNTRSKAGNLHFIDAQTGFAWMTIDDYDTYYVYKTEDGGNSWAQLDSTKGPKYLSGSMGFFDEKNGFAAGPDRWIRSTTDGGQTWESDTLKANFPAHMSLKNDAEEVCVVSETKAWIVGKKFIAYTENTGANWNFVEHGVADIDSSFYTVSFVNEDMGFIGCYDGVILKTTDGGITWEKDETQKGLHRFYCSAFNADNSIFFGTSGGSIIGAKVETSVEELHTDGVVKAFKLEQNYPNPFNPVTRIQFALANEDVVTVKVFDVTGREVATLLDQSMKAGQHVVSFDATNFTSGIYFYQMKTTSFSAVKQMILLK